LKVHDLNCELDKIGLAMITLGGSTGQSVAGVVSTGTHGSDVGLGPIPDVVRAIHLVGPGGQEWWIERSGANAITDPARMEQVRTNGLLCPGIRIEYDDQLFDAALVSVGRMGIVYSYVVEVRNSFNLQVDAERKPWSQAVTTIRDGIRDAAPPSEQWIEIVVNPFRNAAGDHDCVITRKRETSAAPTTTSGSPDYFEILCNTTPINVVLDEIAKLLPPMIATATATAVAGLSWMLLIPILGPELYATAASAAVTAATVGLTTLETAVVAARTVPGDDLAQKIVSFLNAMTDLGHPELIPLLTEQLLGALRPTRQGEVGKGFQMLTGQKPCGAWTPPPECMRQIDGLEFALDLSPGSEKLFGFMDDVFALSEEFRAGGMPIGFVASCRFMAQTRALIGMQRATRNCMVEFVVLRGLRGEEDFLKRLYAIAKKHDAIPHWGLIHEIDAGEVARLYGDRLRDWRLALGRLIDEGGGKPGTFSTSYSIARGLEPLSGGLVFSNNLSEAIRLWDPTPQAEGSVTTTGFYLWNRTDHDTRVTAARFETPQDSAGAPVFQVTTVMPFTVPAHQVRLVDVRFSVPAAGPITGRIEVDSDDSLVPTIRIPLATSARPLGAHAEIQLAPSPLDIGETLVTASIGRNLTITNTGGRDAGLDYVVTMDSPPGQFGIPSVLPRSLSPGQSGTVYVSFNPTSQGQARATLAIDVSSATDLGTVPFHHRYEVPLSGRALRPTIFLARGPRPGTIGSPGGPLLPPSDAGLPPRPPFPRPPGVGPTPLQLELELQELDFGAAAPGSTANSSFWIRNVGDAPLTVQGIAVANQQSFGITDVTIFPATLAPGEELEVQCNFLAYAIPGMGAAGEFLVLSDDPLRHTAVLRVIGRAAGPHLRDPSEVLDLGSVPPDPASATLTFHSDGTDPVTVEKVVLLTETDFGVSGVPTLPASLPPGSDLVLTVSLVSTQPGTYQDRLVVAHDGNPGRSSQILVRAVAQ
jgi:hypothetical protein